LSFTSFVIFVAIWVVSGRESDWLGHITWKGEEEDQDVYPRESRQGSEKACKLGQQFTHILIIEMHEPSTLTFRREG